MSSKTREPFRIAIFFQLKNFLSERVDSFRSV